MLAPVVVEGALFGRAADAAGGYLGDVDVGVVGFGVLGYGEGDGGVGDGFAEEPGYALLGGGVRCVVIGEGRKRLPFGGYGRSHRRGICSGGMLEVEEQLGQEQQTNIHDPFRSCSVLSGGAAIFMCLEVEYDVSVRTSTEIFLRPCDSIDEIYSGFETHALEAQ